MRILYISFGPKFFSSMRTCCLACEQNRQASCRNPMISPFLRRSIGGSMDRTMDLIIHISIHESIHPIHCLLATLASQPISQPARHHTTDSARADQQSLCSNIAIGRRKILICEKVSHQKNRYRSPFFEFDASAFQFAN